MYQRVLRVVGVLILVDQYVPEATTVGVGDLRESAEQVHRLTDEVVEIERVGLLQLTLVVGEHLDEHALGGIAHVGLPRVGLGVGELVLELRDARLHRGRGQSVRIRLVLLDQPLEQSARVAGVVDREGLRVPELLSLAAEDADAGRVERRDPHAPGGVPDQSFDALAHLAGGFVGEGDREDLTRPGLA